MKKYLKLMLLPILLSGCGLLDQRKAVEMNDMIIRSTQRLSAEAQTYGIMLGTAIKTKEFGGLKPERIKILKIVDSAKDVISKTPDVGGSEEFRNYTIEYLRFEKKFVNEAFTPFEQFNAETTPDEVSVAWTTVTKYAEQEKPYLEKLKTLQLAYAEKNHFKLDPNKK